MFANGKKESEETSGCERKMENFSNKIRCEKPQDNAGITRKSTPSREDARPPGIHHHEHGPVHITALLLNDARLLVWDQADHSQEGSCRIEASTELFT